MIITMWELYVYCGLNVDVSFHTVMATNCGKSFIVCVNVM